MEEEHLNNRTFLEEQAKRDHGSSSSAAQQEIPMAYAEQSTDFDRVYALPSAESSPPSSVVRLTKEQETALQKEGFPLGLSQELVRTMNQSMIRCFIIDNSGSMWTADGNVLRGKEKNTQLIPCTRWAEMQSTATPLRMHQVRIQLAKFVFIFPTN